LLDRVVIVVRQSPDWAALADDWRAGRPIDPARYVPPREVSDFPNDIVELIGRWNALSAIDFFTARRRLKEIAQATLHRVKRAVVISCTELARRLQELRSENALLFFCDDDDWFAPQLANLLSPRDYAGADVAVFPFVRFGRGATCTFVRPPFLPSASVGQQYRFPQRYHTNNYGLAPHMWHPDHLVAMQDHFDASDHGDRMGLNDRHLALIIGATSKTPCAASFLPTVVQSTPEQFAGQISFYLQDVRANPIPDALGWMGEPLAATVALFSEVLTGTAVPAR
jgi:hypothetical protein